MQKKKKKKKKYCLRFYFILLLILFVVKYDCVTKYDVAEATRKQTRCFLNEKRN